jgi:hypothetical protein
LEQKEHAIMLVKIKFAIVVLLLGYTTLFPSFTYAKDNSARDAMCEFSSLLVNKGGKSGIDKIVRMFDWNKSVVDKVRNGLAILRDLQYTESLTYIISDFGDLSEQYLIVVSTEEQGTLYLHLSFEKHKNRLRMTNISLKSKLKDLIADHGAFIQTPIKITC